MTGLLLLRGNYLNEVSVYQFVIRTNLP